MQVEAGTDELAIQAIEKRRDGSFVVRVEAPDGVDKGKTEREFWVKYDRELKQIEAGYRRELQAKDREIEIYKQQNANIMELAKLGAGRPIIVEATAVAEKEQNFYAPVGSVDNQGTQNNVAGVNQGIQNATQQPELVDAVEKIQALVEQRERSNPAVTEPEDRMILAAEVVRDIKGNPTLKQQAINAAKGGLLEVLKQNPVGAFVAGAIEGWTKEG